MRISKFKARNVRALVVGSVLVSGLSLAATAAANPLTIVSVVGGAPGASGTNYETFNSLTPGDRSTVTLVSGLTVSFGFDAQPVQGKEDSVYAQPWLSGNNGLQFGNQPDGVDQTVYLTSGSTGTSIGAGVTLSFAGPQRYFGLLWGSVDKYNTLSFYDAANQLVGQITGADVTASANGDQGKNGTFYVNINSSKPFNSVVATSSSYAFEFDNVAWNAHQIGVPEPGILGLFGMGLLLVGGGYWLQRRRLN